MSCTRASSDTVQFRPGLFGVCVFLRSPDQWPEFGPGRSSGRVSRGAKVLQWSEDVLEFKMKKPRTKADWRRMRKESNAKAKRMYTSAHRPPKVTIPGHTDPRVPASTATVERLMKEKGLPRDIVVGQVLRKGWDGNVRFPRLPSGPFTPPAS